MHAQCTRGGGLNEVFMYIKLKRNKENIMYVNGGCVIAIINI
jgi:hypothetical protein